MSGWNWGEVLNVWGEILFRASWQGGLALLAAWGISLVLTGALPRAQCWAWRLAYGKFVVCMLMVAPLALPLLPAEVRRVEESRAAVQVEASDVKAESPGMEAADGNVTTVDGTSALAVSGMAPLVATPRVAERARLTWGRGLRVGLFVLWVAGVLAYFWNVWRAFGRTLRLRRAGRAMEEGAVVAMCAEIAAGMGITRVPRLLRTEDAAGPLLTGVFRPAILLPASLVERSDTQKMRMILAHELAHVKRRDLAWNGFHAVVEGLFFFHPVIWLTRRDVRLAQELACDQVALGATGASLPAYGKMLLEIVTYQRSSKRAYWGVSVASSANALIRRVETMKMMKPWTSRRVMLAAWLMAIVGVVGILPWRAVAQNSSVLPPTAAPLSAGSTSASGDRGTTADTAASGATGRNLADVGGNDSLVTEVIPIKFYPKGADGLTEMLIKAGAVGKTTSVVPNVSAQTVTLMGSPADIQRLADVITVWESEGARYRGMQNMSSLFGFAAKGLPAVKPEDMPPFAWTVEGLLSTPITDVRTPFDGTITMVFVKEGQKVHHGEALFKLDDRAARAAMDIAQIKLRNAVFTMNHTTTDTDGPQAVQQAKTQFELANVEFQTASHAVDDLTICSPSEGVVQDFDVRAGQYLARGTLLTKVVEVQDLRISFYLNASFSIDLHVGQRITVWRYPFGRPVTAEFTYIGDAGRNPADAGSSVLFRAKLVSGDHLEDFKPGMRVVGYIPLKTAQ